MVWSLPRSSLSVIGDLGVLPLGLGEDCPGLRLALLLEPSHRLGGGLVEHAVDRGGGALEGLHVAADLAGVGEAGVEQGGAEVAELGDDLGDVVALLPADPAVLLALAVDLPGPAAEPLGDPIEDLGDVVDELGVREPPGVGDVSLALHGGAPDGDDRIGPLVDVVRQRGGHVLMGAARFDRPAGVARRGGSSRRDEISARHARPRQFDPREGATGRPAIIPGDCDQLVSGECKTALRLDP